MKYSPLVGFLLAFIFVAFLAPAHSATRTAISSTLPAPVFATSSSCLIGAPAGYCDFAACPNGYTCSNPTNQRITKTSSGTCVLGGSGYTIGSCVPSTPVSSTTTTTIATTTTTAIPPSPITSTTSTSTSSTSTTSTVSLPPGVIVITTHSFADTPYPDAQGGSLVASASPQQPNSVTSQSLKYTNASAQWLITCPSQPNPSDTMLYFSSEPGSYIGGDICLAQPTTLSTTASLTTTISWSTTQVASASTTFSIENPGIASVQNLGYEGATNTTSNYFITQQSGQSEVYEPFTPAALQPNCEVSLAAGVASDIASACGWDQPVSGTLYFMGHTYNAELYTNSSNPSFYWAVFETGLVYYGGRVPSTSVGSSPTPTSTSISNGYDTNSYIFSQVPSGSQAGIWTWNFEYANFSKMVPSQLTQPTQTFPGLVYDAPDGCSYTYTFSESVNFQSIQNANIPIPSSAPTIQQNYMEMSSSLYYPVTEITSDFSGISGNLRLRCLYNGYCLTSSDLVNVNYISSNGTLNYGGKTYDGPYGTGLYVYQGIGQLAGDYVVVTNPSFNTYRAYAVPDTIASTENVSFLPYFLYSLSMPASASDASARVEPLNLSFDIYSPRNYLHGSSLDPFQFYTGSGFFATVNGSLAEFPSNSLSSQSGSAFSSPTINFISGLPASQGSSGISNLLSQTVQAGSGSYGIGEISNPIYIASSPNDYIYLLNYTSTSQFGFGPSTTTNLFKLRYIPYGYYNLTYTQPNFVVGQYAPSSNAWTSEWQSYWNAVLPEQASNLYVTNVTTLTDTTNKLCFFSLCIPGSIQPGVTFGSLIPLALTSDYADDVFLVGANRYNLGTEFQLAAVFSNGTTATNNVKPGAIGGFQPAGMIAADPGGQFIYLANYSYGFIPIFAANTLSDVSSIPLNYSNSTYSAQLNITKYLANGGPFNDSQIASAYAGMQASNDIMQYHRPVALFASGGLLYLVDDWAFMVDGQQSSVLMLRVFLDNGTEVPIRGTPNYDLSVPASTLDLSQGNSGSIYSYPPYGWPLAANISIGNGGYVTYCMAGCTFTPSNPPPNDFNGYLPIGPMINVTGGVGPMSSIQSGSPGKYLAFSSSFNGTVYMLTHDIPHNIVSSYRCTGGEYGTCTKVSTDKGKINPNPYTLLVGFTPNIENYTKLSNGANAPFQCYINTTAYTSPCVTNYNISQLWPPFSEIPSSFSYVTGEGAPQTFFSAGNLYESLYPTGVASNNASESSYANNITSNTSVQNTANEIETNALASLAGAPVPFSPFVQTSTYMRSVIDGYMLLPYYVSYIPSESWDTTSASGNYTVDGVTYNCTTGGGPNGSSSSPTAGYTALQIPVESNQANSTVEGGATYAYLPALTQYYDANVSDANLAMPPQIYFRMFSDRVFGDIYVNQSVSPSQQYALQVPLFINGTRSYNYSLVTFTQDAGGKDYAGYAIEEAVPFSSQYIQTGTATAPQNDAGLKLFAGASSIGSSNTSAINYVSLFQTYARLSHTSDIVLGLQGDQGVLGYNRLVYTFVDRFNNTIYMPVDVDLTNLTTISLNINTLINATNDNETLVMVNGTAGDYSGLFGTSYAPLPKGSSIYLYYDTNLNFYPPAGQESSLTPGTLAYAEYQDLCAFDPAMICTLANPVDTSQQPYAAEYASHVDFATQYNSIVASGASGTCSLQPKGLLNISRNYNCNIYGAATDNGPAVYDPNTGSYAYCVPDFANGTGMLTTQIGLIREASTNGTGFFKDNSINTCGTGTSKVIAKYFGAPAPQPMTYTQPPIAQSASIPPADSEPFTELGYTYAPNESIASFQTGNYALSFSAIGVAALLSGMAALVALLLKSARSKRHE
ncbi:MAG: hypothetical protein M1158_01460 [Candidatus Marsarchaeota archaeon]|nr:hypothetical protein [Candidatus Marsarchaeota archaeon]